LAGSNIDNLLVFNGKVVKHGLSLVDSREGNNVVELAVLLDLDNLRLVLFRDQIADSLLVLHVGHEENVAGLLLAGSGRVAGLFVRGVSIGSGFRCLLLAGGLSRGRGRGSRARRLGNNRNRRSARTLLALRDGSTSRRSLAELRSHNGGASSTSRGRRGSGGRETTGNRLRSTTGLRLATAVGKVEALSPHLCSNTATLNLEDEVTESSICQVEVPHVLKGTLIDLTSSVTGGDRATEGVATIGDGGHLGNHI
jgi:hypothetical protein